MFKAISHIYLPVLNLDESIRFYTENLGFSLYRRWSPAPGREAGYVRLGEILIEMGQAAPERRAELLTGGGKFGVEVENLDEALAELRAKGVEVLDEGPPMRSFSGRQCRIKDPSGWEIALRQWLDGDGPLNYDWTPKA